jgi:ssDNA-binding Zn-finger/Zn-ribbon topoisomerase 1
MSYTVEQISRAMELLPTLWIRKYKIKNEAGNPIEFVNHNFLRDIYNDFTPVQAILKAPQIGMTVLEVIKSLWVAKKLGKDIIYTLPTSTDVNDMAGGKVNRIIAQNPILLDWVKDHDTVDQKAVGDNIIYYRGTWINKAAMMVSSQLNIHDEVDASKPEVIVQYETRLQASTGGWRWYFSHPSAPDVGVDMIWKQSDQKHWFVKCPCGQKQYLSWSMDNPSEMSVDIERKIYVCKECQQELSDEVRRKGQWVKKYNDREISGYWISQLMCPWIPASKVIKDFQEKDPTYFYNYVLGLPFGGDDSKLTKEGLFQNLTTDILTPAYSERIVIGIDTGLKIDFVMGSKRGLFYQGETKDYDELDRIMKQRPRAIAVIDAGGDLIGSRKFVERWPGRVFLCFFREDRKTKQLIQWGEKNEYGTVIADRNRMIQMVVSEFGDKRIPLQGTEVDWHDYWLDWNNLARIKVFHPITGELKGMKWVRSGRDHRCLATIYWRIGMARFGGDQAFFGSPPIKWPTDAGLVSLPELSYSQSDDWRKS